MTLPFSPPSPEELAELDRLASLGDLTGPVLHEFNNFLNILNLKLVMLGHQASAKGRSELEAVRSDGMAVAELIGRVQRYKQAARPDSLTTDLNTAVRAVIGSLGGRTDAPEGELELPGAQFGASADGPATRGSVRLRWQCAAEVLTVPGVRWEVRRLIWFLVINSGRTFAADGGQILLRTQASSTTARLILEDDGPAIAGPEPDFLFEIAKQSRPGIVSLEMAACGSIVRRLKGRLRPVNRPGGGVQITVEFAATNGGAEDGRR